MTVYWGPDMTHSETGVSYFRDYHYNTHEGWNRLEYRWYSESGHTGINHVYIEGPLRRAIDDLKRLCEWWTRGNWRYEVG